MAFKILDEHVEIHRPSQGSFGTMHVAKGLQFQAVVVMACEEKIRIILARAHRNGRRGQPICKALMPPGAAPTLRKPVLQLVEGLSPG